MGWLSRMFGEKRGSPSARPASVFFTNTLSGTKELFVPQRPDAITMYSCGPTVYGQQHIGNLRAAIFSDSVARVLKGANYRVKRVTNITDVGHLVGDGDRGEDKMAVGARQEETTPEEIAERYTKIFINDIEELNVDIHDIQFPRATAYIKEQIALAKTLEEKGFAYYLPDGLYFDTQQFPGYGKLGNISQVQLEAGKRVELVKGKRHPADFVLWRTAKPNDLQQWDSPWGSGNPGWHIECSAMIRSLLGQEIDIHTGGEEHVAIHHNNEIAQSEAANGRTFVHYWLHNAHLTLGGDKISKSIGNAVYLSDVSKHALHPLSLRYFFLQAHYRTPLSFSWGALGGANEGLQRLWRLSADIAHEAHGKSAPSEARGRFLAAVRDDLATPQALGILWDALRSEEYAPAEKWGLLQDAEIHFGLLLTTPPTPEGITVADLPKHLQELLKRRIEVREMKDFAQADRIREEIEKGGYRVEDGPNGPVLTKTTL